MLKQSGADATDGLKTKVTVLRSVPARDLRDTVEKAYEESREDVYYYLLTLGLTPAQAQETAQEVFLRLYVVMKKGDVIDNVRAWVFRVAHNLGINVRRKEDRLGPLDTQRGATQPSSQDGPEQSLLKRDRERRLREAFAQLSDQQRFCLHLRAEGLRYREIAEAAGISTSSVGEFLRRGIQKLRQVIHD
jgi:RNA polymerase sigma-70 factor (ECF subfamily)